MLEKYEKKGRKILQRFKSKKRVKKIYLKKCLHIKYKTFILKNWFQKLWMNFKKVGEWGGGLSQNVSGIYTPDAIRIKYTLRVVWNTHVTDNFKMFRRRKKFPISSFFYY